VAQDVFSSRCYDHPVSREKGKVAQVEGKLFSQDFLQYGITETPPWREISDERLAALHREPQAVSVFRRRMSLCLRSTQTESL
jgi:hypothetical protein